MRDPIPSDLRPGLTVLADCVTGVGMVVGIAAIGLSSWPLAVAAVWIGGAGVVSRLLLTAERTP